MKVRVGEYNMQLDTKEEPLPHQERLISQIRIHPEYNPNRLVNDMALMVVVEPFHFVANVAPICFPQFNTMFATEDIYDHRRCVATGWGKDAFGMFISTFWMGFVAILLHNSVNVVVCGKTYSPQFQHSLVLLISASQ